MFVDVVAAKEVLTEYFNEPGVELLLRVMQPAIGFEPSEAWPVRPVPVDAEAIAARGGSRHAPHLQRHLAQPLPFEFLAQVDLAEAAALGEVAEELPREGRLLFF